MGRGKKEEEKQDSEVNRATSKTPLAFAFENKEGKKHDVLALSLRREMGRRAHARLAAGARPRPRKSTEKRGRAATTTTTATAATA